MTELLWISVERQINGVNLAWRCSELADDDATGPPHDASICRLSQSSG
ncbi:hypothetical protein KFU94_10970 [Chloroflexi bacterium TSY]|nr:hypothetical protein [Chloroflexi bacterium TSY]